MPCAADADRVRRADVASWPGTAFSSTLRKSPLSQANRTSLGQPPKAAADPSRSAAFRPRPVFISTTVGTVWKTKTRWRCCHQDPAAPRFPICRRRTRSARALAAALSPFAGWAARHLRLWAKSPHLSRLCNNNFTWFLLLVEAAALFRCRVARSDPGYRARPPRDAATNVQAGSLKPGRTKASKPGRTKASVPQHCRSLRLARQRQL
jgi:hypothetical protein